MSRPMLDAGGPTSLSGTVCACVQRIQETNDERSRISRLGEILVHPTRLAKGHIAPTGKMSRRLGRRLDISNGRSESCHPLGSPHSWKIRCLRPANSLPPCSLHRHLAADRFSFDQSIALRFTLAYPPPGCKSAVDDRCESPPAATSQCTGGKNKRICRRERENSRSAACKFTAGIQQI